VQVGVIDVGANTIRLLIAASTSGHEHLDGKTGRPLDATDKLGRIGSLAARRSAGYCDLRAAQ
jgi:exopolyphosphatase/pppGpp-phosphohydrolase